MPWHFGEIVDAERLHVRSGGAALQSGGALAAAADASFVETPADAKAAR